MNSRPMPSPQQVVQFVRPSAATQHADRPVIPAAGTMPGSFEAEMAVEHCSDRAGVVSGDYLPRAAGCCSVSGFDLRLDHHGLCALLGACFHRMIVVHVGRLLPLLLPRAVLGR